MGSRVRCKVLLSIFGRDRSCLRCGRSGRSAITANVSCSKELLPFSKRPNEKLERVAFGLDGQAPGRSLGEVVTAAKNFEMFM